MKPVLTIKVIKYKDSQSKTKVLEAKRKKWEEFGHKMKTDSMGNAKLLYITIQKLQKKPEEYIRCIEDLQGQLVTTNTQIMDRLQE